MLYMAFFVELCALINDNVKHMLKSSFKLK